MAAGSKILLGILAAIPIVGGGVALAMSGPKKTSKGSGTMDNAGGAVDQTKTVPFVKFTCPDCPTGIAYALRPELRDPLWNALQNWYVIAQDITDNRISWGLAPRSQGQPPNAPLQQNLSDAKAQGASVLVDPSIVIPATGQRSILLVPQDQNPWPYTSPGMVLYIGTGAWAFPPGPESGAPAGDALSGLPASLRTSVQHLADAGPLRSQTAMADALDSEGYTAAAAWLRTRAKERAAVRRANMEASGGSWEYLLRKGELPPYLWTERYLGPGNGPRYVEISQPKGWNYGQKIRLPGNSWPDPETRDPASLLGTFPQKSTPQPVASPVAPPSQAPSPNQSAAPTPPASSGMLGDVRLGKSPPANPTIGAPGLDPSLLPGSGGGWDPFPNIEAWDWAAARKADQ